MSSEIDREAFMVDRVAKIAFGDRPSMKMMSSGHPLENGPMRILDESGNDLPESTIGEVALKSNCMLTSYFNLPI